MASLLLLVLSWPAFKYFFFAEAFTHLRIYNVNGRHLWQAAFSRVDEMFFRPGLFLADIGWHFVLAPDPLAYHTRNFVFCVINLFLFHRVLLRFVATRPARIVALLLVAASKMYLTIIGYISVYEASVLLMTILLAVLFWARYIAARRIRDYVLALLCCTLSAYSKDNGFIVVGVLAAMIPALAPERVDVPDGLRYWSVRFAPFAVVSASYLALRYYLTGPINSENPVYSPRLSISGALWQAKAFMATVGNLSLSEPGFMGRRGLGGVLADDSKIVELVLCAVLWLFILYTLWQGRVRWRLLLVPVVWIASYLFPIFLIRNHQVYYHQEPLVGVALMIGICLDRATRPLLTTWSVVVAVIAVNGFISNRRSHYYWEETADRAEIVKPIVAARKSNPPKAIVFVTSPGERNFWTFAVGGPLLPQLLGAPDMGVSIVDSTPPVRPGVEIHQLP